MKTRHMLFPRHLSIVLLTLFALLTACGIPPETTVSPQPAPPETPTKQAGRQSQAKRPGGKFAFVDDAGTWLWEDGTIVQVSPMQAEELAWHPDGQRLAYGKNRMAATGTVESQPPTVIWLYDTATGQSDELGTCFCCSATFHWSPDGTKLARCGAAPSGSGYRAAFAVYDVVGGWTELWKGCGGRHTFSPDGARMAFATGQCYNAASDFSTVSLLDFHNHDESQILARSTDPIDPGSAYPRVKDLAWSPDGDTIAVTLEGSEPDWLALVSPDQTSPVNPLDLYPGLLPPSGVPPTVRTIIHSNWSSDGRYLAVVEGLGESYGGSNLYLLKKKFGKWKVHRFGQMEVAYSEPLWSPDDSMVAIQSEAGRIYLYPVPNGEPHVFSIGENPHNLVWVPNGSGLTAIVNDTVYWLPADGASPELLLTRPGLGKPIVWIGRGVIAWAPLTSDGE